MNETTAEKCLRSFSYRGPDYTGFTFSEGIFLGTNRLSIQDVDERSNQPFTTSDKKVMLIFNGEVYNFPQLRSELKKSGLEFDTNSDTEVVLKGYQTWGTGVFSRLSGMYAIAIMDKKENKLYLARDHVGMKPLYYVVKTDGIAFSSEMKGISHLSNKELSRDAFLYASALGYIPAPYTLYQDVHKLERGSLLSYNLSSNEIVSIEEIYPEISSQIDSINELGSLIENKVLEHLISDAPVGLFFSGGNDSSLIAAILKKNNIQLNSYSILMEHKGEDSKYIKNIGKHLGLKPKILNYDLTEFEKSLKSTLGLFDEPTWDSSLLAVYGLSKIAKEEVKVVLSGEGGDEFFYGYERHKYLHNHRKLQSNFIVDAILRTPFVNRSHKYALVQRITRVTGDGFGYYLSATAKGGGNIGWKEVRNLFKKNDVLPIDLDQEFYLEGDLLRKMDFATSYASVEGRMPFLDREVIAASKNFKNSFIDTGVTKYALKEVLATYVGPEQAYRNKSGLGLPVKSFFGSSQSYKELLEEALINLRNSELGDLVQTESTEDLILECPHYTFLLITYWNAIKNT